MDGSDTRVGYLQSTECEDYESYKNRESFALKRKTFLPSTKLHTVSFFY